MYGFPEMLEQISKHFKLWELIGEGKHHLLDIHEQIRSLAPSYDIQFSLHAPFSDLNIASLNKWILDETMRQLKGSLELCPDLGIELVTLHPGLNSPLATYDLSLVPPKNKEALKELDRLGNDLGLTLAFENMPKYWSTTCWAPDELLAAIEGTDIGVCFDVGHANLSNNIDDFLEHVDKFVNFHIHDNEGRGDSHLVLGEGNIDFDKVLKAMSGYKGHYIIESTGLEDGIKSKKILERWLH